MSAFYAYSASVDADFLESASLATEWVGGGASQKTLERVCDAFREVFTVEPNLKQLRVKLGAATGVREAAATWCLQDRQELFLLSDDPVPEGTVRGLKLTSAPDGTSDKSLEASMITSKAAIRERLKTGHMEPSGTMF